mmetsp:Transcript_31477/g.53849  ORF Transcript_31477/g.53849 Transcript_31477/m.53849 type:complete len:122 (-) Transcript_31477:1459-1824(-)
MTRSERAEAITKSCSTMKAVFCMCEMIQRRMTLEAITRCSQSRPAEGSSSRYTVAGVPRQMVIATRCSSPPERCFTWNCSSDSMSSGLSTSSRNMRSAICAFTYFSSSAWTVPSNLRSFGA